MGEESESTGGNKLLNILIVLIVIIIWLAIFALLIKMNVGGIGSMLRPYLKNIPGINMILPDAQMKMYRRNLVASIRAFRRL